MTTCQQAAEREGHIYIQTLHDVGRLLSVDDDSYYCHCSGALVATININVLLESYTAVSCLAADDPFYVP